MSDLVTGSGGSWGSERATSRAISGSGGDASPIAEAHPGITAVYSGDATNVGGTSLALTHTTAWGLRRARRSRRERGGCQFLRLVKDENQCRDAKTSK